MSYGHGAGSAATSTYLYVFWSGLTTDQRENMPTGSSLSLGGINMFYQDDNNGYPTSGSTYNHQNFCF